MNSTGSNLSIGEAANYFLAGLPSGDREVNQQEIFRFARWFGWERSVAGLTAPEVANYAERLSLSDIDYARKLELVRAFLIYTKKEGWIKGNLVTHLKTKKGKAKMSPSARPGLPETHTLTRQGYTELEMELAALKEKRPQIIEEIRRAAADKDFRENAPLQAAKEQHGHLEGRIRELEEALKSATIIDEKQEPALQVSTGDHIILRDLTSGEELHYTIVSPREVDPSQGKISSASPIGKAVIGRSVGKVVEVEAPVGMLRYEIKQVER